MTSVVFHQIAHSVLLKNSFHKKRRNNLLIIPVLDQKNLKYIRSIHTHTLTHSLTHSLTHTHTHTHKDGKAGRSAAAASGLAAGAWRLGTTRRPDRDSDRDELEYYWWMH